mmetsp:Transcript_35625/g.77490  ORF Transcript_35625/g.77490 Transcript_35625/m.77490 type:complete len:334 (+) Transcript_35625:1431-2432(+)
MASTFSPKSPRKPVFTVRLWPSISKSASCTSRFWEALSHCKRYFVTSLKSWTGTTCLKESGKTCLKTSAVISSVGSNILRQSGSSESKLVPDLLLECFDSPVKDLLRLSNFSSFLGMSVTRTAYCEALTDTSRPSCSAFTPLMWRTEGRIITSLSKPSLEPWKLSLYTSHHLSAAKDFCDSNIFDSFPSSMLDWVLCLEGLVLLLLKLMLVLMTFRIEEASGSPWYVAMTEFPSMRMVCAGIWLVKICMSFGSCPLLSRSLSGIIQERAMSFQLVRLKTMSLMLCFRWTSPSSSNGIGELMCDMGDTGLVFASGDSSLMPGSGEKKVSSGPGV